MSCPNSVLDWLTGLPVHVHLLENHLGVTYLSLSSLIMIVDPESGKDNYIYWVRIRRRIRRLATARKFLNGASFGSRPSMNRGIRIMVLVFAIAHNSY